MIKFLKIDCRKLLLQNDVYYLHHTTLNLARLHSKQWNDHCINTVSFDIFCTDRKSWKKRHVKRRLTLHTCTCKCELRRIFTCSQVWRLTIGLFLCLLYVQCHGLSRSISLFLNNSWIYSLLKHVLYHLCRLCAQTRYWKESAWSAFEGKYCTLTCAKMKMHQTAHNKKKASMLTTI